jgi:hypothetical protein
MSVLANKTQCRLYLQGAFSRQDLQAIRVILTVIQQRIDQARLHQSGRLKSCLEGGPDLCRGCETQCWTALSPTTA